MTEARARRDDDRPVSLGTSFTYSLGLGIATVTIPLRAPGLTLGRRASAVPAAASLVAPEPDR